MAYRHQPTPLLTVLHMHPRGDVADEAAVRGAAEALACGQAPAPAGLVGGQLDDVAQPAGGDGEVLVWLSAVPARLRQAGRLPVALPRRPAQLPPEHLVAAAQSGPQPGHALMDPLSH